ncbi:Holliday junction resolvase RuvX [Celeribacter litoreus]|uniref:Holliday junction resolvase RuvX n=1 Tax=Celeribacter litoreus TaxID=2876714 RepID=UPI001CC9F8B1|nr:Holliday junction resolvase RuvX [Celeribacter litoreus]MCA0043746.1 Holliday junction resolvase RuvX [Celeribacter litoreus]
MITDDLSEFVATLPPMAPLAGLDFGDKTIGIAISDRLRSVASPTDTIRRKKFGVDAEKLLALLTQREVGGIVLGLPRNMDGSEGPRCQKTRAFARNLGQLTELPITFWDERLSSVMADRAMLEADMSRAKRSEKIDQVAAGVILQGALDRLRNL